MRTIGFQSFFSVFGSYQRSRQMANEETELPLGIFVINTVKLLRYSFSVTFPSLMTLLRQEGC